MKEDYEKVSSDLADIVKDWWAWRLDKITVEWKSDWQGFNEKSWNWVEVQDRQTRTHKYVSSKTSWRGWMEKYQKEMMERVPVMYSHSLFVLEFVPMLKPCTILHRLIPGREEDPVQPGGSLPQLVRLGPLSQWLMDTWPSRLSGVS